MIFSELTANPIIVHLSRDVVSFERVTRQLIAKAKAYWLAILDDSLKSDFFYCANIKHFKIILNGLK